MIKAHGSAGHHPGQGTAAAATLCQEQLVDGPLEGQGGTQWLLRKILYVTKSGFKGTLAKRKGATNCRNLKPPESE